MEPTQADVQAYNEAHRALLEITSVGPIVDVLWTCTSRIRVLMESQEKMEYTDGDPLYDSANAVDHAISELLNVYQANGIDTSPARLPMPPQRMDSDPEFDSHSRGV